MKKVLVINPKNIQTRSPISFTLILYLVFDKWNVPMWVYGAVGMIILIWFIAWIINIIHSETIDIFEGLKPDKGLRRYSFTERLEELRKKKNA